MFKRDYPFRFFAVYLNRVKLMVLTKPAHSSIFVFKASLEPILGWSFKKSCNRMEAQNDKINNIKLNKKKNMIT